jgi:hypothetical protein
MARHAGGGLVMTGRELVNVREGWSRMLYASHEIPVLNDVTAAPSGRLIVGCLRFGRSPASVPRPASSSASTAPS